MTTTKCRNCGHDFSIHNGQNNQCRGNPKPIGRGMIRVCGCTNPEPEVLQ